MGQLAEVEGRMNADQLIDVLETTYCLTWRNVGFLQRISSFSRIMIPKTPPKRPKCEGNTMTKPQPEMTQGIKS